MEIRWLTAFIDLPGPAFEAGTRFWLEVTGSTPSPLRGDPDEDGQRPFATLLPPAGDPYLRVQRLGPDQPDPRIHLDLHVDDIGQACNRARTLGATVVAEPGHVVMASPGGLPFCFVSHHGEGVRPRPLADPHPHVVDQVSIDVPADRFEREAAFWADLTGWDLRPAGLDEFQFLVRPAGLPLRLLLQRLGDDDGGSRARAHLDLSCGEHLDEIVALHRELGAEPLGRFRFWVPLRDPAGAVYCLTARDPQSGMLG